MKILFIALLIFFGCSSSPTINESNLVSVIDELHGKKITKKNLMEKISVKFEDKGEYLILPSKYAGEFIETIFLFNKDNEQTLMEVSHYSFSQKLEEKLAKINCKWNRKEEYKSFNRGHTIELVKEGACTTRDVSFSYSSKISQYIIRWQW